MKIEHVAIVRFVIIGPFAGTFGYVVADQLLQITGVSESSLAQTHTFMEALQAASFLWLYGLVLAYPLGLLPALVAALVYPHFARKHHLKFRSRALLGALVGLVPAALLGVLFSQDAAWLSFASWGAAGALGGAASAAALPDTRQHNVA